MTNKITELFGLHYGSRANWKAVARDQQCPFLQRKCLKIRKSQPEISIGTCSIRYGEGAVVICPHRLLENRQVFLDAIHLLTSHQPGNELHVIPEVSIPGGNVDYFLVSARERRVEDFVGIELQTLDTTGTLWPERQRFLIEKGVLSSDADANSNKGFGMNWKMTAKTTLVQLHHKVETFEHINKHLVLVIQNSLADYIRREFSFAHVGPARLGDPMHIHSYRFDEKKSAFRIVLIDRFSTDSAGIAKCLGLKAEARIEMATIIRQLERKISDRTLLKLRAPLPARKLSE